MLFRSRVLFLLLCFSVFFFLSVSCGSPKQTLSLSFCLLSLSRVVSPSKPRHFVFVYLCVSVVCECVCVIAMYYCRRVHACCDDAEYGVGVTFKPSRSTSWLSFLYSLSHSSLHFTGTQPVCLRLQPILSFLLLSSLLSFLFLHLPFVSCFVLFSHFPPSPSRPVVLDP